MSPLKTILALTSVAMWTVTSAVTTSPVAHAADPMPNEAVFSLIHNGNGSCLDANGDHALYTSSCGEAGTTKVWHISYSSVSDYVAVENVHFPACVDSNRELAYTNPCNGSRNVYQLYHRSYEPDHVTFLIQSSQTHLCLQAYPNRRILPRPCAPISSQGWRIEDLH